ncbi:MAG: zinc-binding dehydrogenase [Alphaproteobacteria bacterium]|nr:zinc-binding dehydrogenase [Alphaproteobacteria bacterium]
MPKAVRVHEYGGPEVLRYEDADVGEPDAGEVLLRHTAIGLNYADIHTRNGRYPLPHFPHVIGGEGCGVVEALGPDVTNVAVGDRVAYSSGGHALPRGSYCELRTMNAERLVKLPESIADQTAAAMITKGLTAQYLIHDSHPVSERDAILVHSAAGGVGMIIAQWARTFGAHVIGVVSSDEKASFAADHGCHDVIISTQEDIVERAKSFTDGEGVTAVFDAVGVDTFEASLAALRPLGRLVAYGSSSGPVPPFDIFRLNEMGSLSITAGAFYWHMRTGDEVRARAKSLFDIVSSGAVKIEINQRFALADAADAHRAMESRSTFGMTVMTP